MGRLEKITELENLKIITDRKIINEFRHYVITELSELTNLMSLVGFKEQPEQVPFNFQWVYLDKTLHTYSINIEYDLKFITINIGAKRIDATGPQRTCSNLLNVSHSFFIDVNNENQMIKNAIKCVNYEYDEELKPIIREKKLKRIVK